MINTVLDKKALEDIKAAIEVYLNNKPSYLNTTIRDNEGNFYELVLQAGPDYSEDNKVNTPCMTTLKLVHENIDDEEIDKIVDEDKPVEPKQYEE